MLATALVLALASGPEEGPSETAPSSATDDSCPCYGIDARCWQRHPECVQEALPPPRDDDASAPPPPPRPVFVSWPRRGLILRGSTGITHCAQAFCDAIAMGGLARFDIAYRLGYYSIYATVSGGGGVLDMPDFEDPDDGPVTNIRGGLTFLFAGVGMMAHPVDLGRVDPWLGVAIGYARTEQRLRADQVDTTTVLSRGGVELGGGLDVFLHRRVAIGPRFDVVFPFGGSVCVDADCVNVADIVDADLPAQRRMARRSFPRPWSVTVGATIFVL